MATLSPPHLALQNKAQPLARGIVARKSLKYRTMQAVSHALYSHCMAVCQAATPTNQTVFAPFPETAVSRKSRAPKTGPSSISNIFSHLAAT